MNALIKIDFLPGTTIKNAFVESERLSKTLGVAIEFKFNGIICLAYAFMNIEKGINDYHKRLKKD